MCGSAAAGGAKVSYQLPHEDNLLDFILHPAPSPDWVIAGLEPGDVGLLSAPGGTGKSMFCLSLAVAVAGGENLFGKWAVGETGDVFYVYAEDSPSILHRRFQALHAINPISEDVLHRLHTVCVRTAPPLFMIDGIRGVAESNTDVVRALAEYIYNVTGANPRLLVLDPLVKFHTLDENSNNEMAQLMTLFTRVAEELKIAILITHHTGKGAVLSGNASTQQSARGASAIVDQSRFQIVLFGIDERTATMHGIRDEERWKYLVASTPKINGTARLEDLLLERGPGGVLMRANLQHKLADGALKVVRRGRGEITW